jgi:hypothetical protein
MARSAGLVLVGFLLGFVLSGRVHSRPTSPTHIRLALDDEVNFSVHGPGVGPQHHKLKVVKVMRAADTFGRSDGDGTEWYLTVPNGDERHTAVLTTR